MVTRKVAAAVAVPLALAASLVFAACSEEASFEEPETPAELAVAEPVELLHHALEAGDGDLACSQLEPTLATQRAANADVATCPESVNPDGEPVDGDPLVHSIDIEGSEATAYASTEYAGAQDGWKYSLERGGGGAWLITDADFLGSATGE